MASRTQEKNVANKLCDLSKEVFFFFNPLSKDRRLPLFTPSIPFPFKDRISKSGRRKSACTRSLPLPLSSLGSQYSTLTLQGRCLQDSTGDQPQEGHLPTGISHNTLTISALSVVSNKGNFWSPSSLLGSSFLTGS